MWYHYVRRERASLTTTCFHIPDSRECLMIAYGTRYRLQPSGREVEGRLPTSSGTSFDDVWTVAVCALSRVGLGPPARQPGPTRDSSGTVGSVSPRENEFSAVASGLAYFHCSVLRPEWYT